MLEALLSTRIGISKTWSVGIAGALGIFDEGHHSITHAQEGRPAGGQSVTLGCSVVILDAITYSRRVSLLGVKMRPAIRLLRICRRQEGR